MRARQFLPVVIVLLLLLGLSRFSASSQDGGKSALEEAAQTAYAVANSSQPWYFDWNLEYELTGHTATVTSVTFSPDGTLLASTSRDGTVRIWDSSDWTEVQTLTGHASSVESVAFSPDGTLLASGSWDDTVRIWDTSDWTEVQTLTGHASSVESVVFSSDGTWLATAYDGYEGGEKIEGDNLWIWDTSDWTVVKTFELYHLKTVAFSPDSTILAAGYNVGYPNYEGSVTIWDSSNWSTVQSLTGIAGTVDVLAFSSDGTRLATSSSSAYGWDFVKIWDTSDWTVVQMLDDWTRYAIFSPDGSRLGEHDYWGGFTIWDTSNWTKVSDLNVVWLICPLTFSPDGSWIAGCGSSEYNTVVIWTPILTDSSTEVSEGDTSTEEFGNLPLVIGGLVAFTLAGVSTILFVLKGKKKRVERIDELEPEDKNIVIEVKIITHNLVTQVVRGNCRDIAIGTLEDNPWGSGDKVRWDYKDWALSPNLKAGAIVRIEGCSVNEYQGKLSLDVNQTSRVIVLQEGTATLVDPTEPISSAGYLHLGQSQLRQHSVPPPLVPMTASPIQDQMMAFQSVSPTLGTPVPQMSTQQYSTPQPPTPTAQYASPTPTYAPEAPTYSPTAPTDLAAAMNALSQTESTQQPPPPPFDLDAAIAKLGGD